jgi:hypothetical protein
MAEIDRQKVRGAFDRLLDGDHFGIPQDRDFFAYVGRMETLSKAAAAAGGRYRDELDGINVWGRTKDGEFRILAADDKGRDGEWAPVRENGDDDRMVIPMHPR